MQDRVPTQPPVPTFTPVPRKHARHDGWTPERQRAFIDALADTGSVTHAARRINMASEGAYQLRRQPGAESFRAAWAAALDHGVQCLTDLAIDRAKEGVAVPIMYKGEQVGERRRYNDRLLMWILRHHAPVRYGDGHAEPEGEVVTPEVRQRIYAEMKKEEEARIRERNGGKSAAQLLVEKLDRIGARLRGEDPDLVLPYPEDDWS